MDLIFYSQVTIATFLKMATYFWPCMVFGVGYLIWEHHYRPEF